MCAQPLDKILKAWHEERRWKDVFVDVRPASYKAASIVGHEATISLTPRDLDRASIVILSVRKGTRGIVYIEQWRRINQRLSSKLIDDYFDAWDADITYGDAALDSENLSGIEPEMLIEICDAVSNGHVRLDIVSWNKHAISSWGGVGLPAGFVSLNGQGLRSNLARRIIASLPLGYSTGLDFKNWKSAY